MVAYCRNRHFLWCVLEVWYLIRNESHTVSPSMTTPLRGRVSKVQNQTDTLNQLVRMLSVLACKVRACYSFWCFTASYRRIKTTQYCQYTITISSFHMCQFWISSGGDFRHGSSSLKQIVRAGFSTQYFSQSLVDIQVNESPLWPADHTVIYQAKASEHFCIYHIKWLWQCQSQCEAVIYNSSDVP